MLPFGTVRLLFVSLAFLPTLRSWSLFPATTGRTRSPPSTSIAASCKYTDDDDDGCDDPLRPFRAAETPRRTFLTSSLAGLSAFAAGSKGPTTAAFAADEQQTPLVSSEAAQVSVSGDASKLFNEGRALESQGNMAAAQRIYIKVVQIAPRFISGWSSLGNTQTVFGDLRDADESYTKAIGLCRENLSTTEEGFGIKRCSDLYVLLLNRGAIRLNNGMAKEALADLEQSEALRGRPDAVVLQNVARARELNGLYSQADRDYTTAISMTANEVVPFWLRAVNVKFQLGEIQEGFDLLKRVNVRFPEAPEVRAAYATFLFALGEDTKARQKFLEIPDRQRLKYVDKDYLTKTISWPPAMLNGLAKVTAAVGDS